MSQFGRKSKRWTSLPSKSNQPLVGKQAIQKNILPSEYDIQKAIIDWAALIRYKSRYLGDYIHHSPNGGYRNAIEAKRFRDAGVRSGYPDLTIDIAKKGYHGMRIELKRGNLGSLSAAQKERIEMLKEEGYYVLVCTKPCEAIGKISDYLDI